MPDLLVAVLHLHAAGARAWLADVDAPGTVLREASQDRRTDAVDAARSVLHGLDAAGLGSQLLALAVAVDANDARALLEALGDELPEGWGLPASLPVVVGQARTWAAQGQVVPTAPLVAGAAVAAAKAVGAHAHLPHAAQASDSATS